MKNLCYLFAFMISCVTHFNSKHKVCFEAFSTTNQSKIQHHCGMEASPHLLSPSELTASLTSANTSKKWREIEWNPNRKLRWDDFKARPNMFSSYSAVTSTYIEETHGCNDYGRFAFHVKAVFVQNLSWIRGRYSKDLLKHEQIHFDITEYHARLMRKYFSELKYPCYREDDIARAVERIFNAMETAQHQYDDETYHGLYKNRQAKWEQYISTQLKSLSEYKL